MSTKITNRRDKFNGILKTFSEYYNEPVEALARLAFEKGATKGEIAESLKVNPSVITKKYKKLFDALKEVQA